MGGMMRRMARKIFAKLFREARQKKSSGTGGQRGTNRRGRP